MKKILRAIVSGILETLEERDENLKDDNNDGNDDGHDDGHDDTMSDIEHIKSHIEKLEEDKLKQQQYYKKHADKANYYLEFINLLVPIEKYRKMIDDFDFKLLHTLAKILEKIANTEKKIDLFLK